MLKLSTYCSAVQATQKMIVIFKTMAEALDQEYEVGVARF